MLYKYRAKKGPSQIVEDILEAISEADALEKLNAAGLVALKIEECKAQAQGPASQQQPVASTKKSRLRIKSSEVTVFSRQLASLLKAGVPILRSLNIISEQSDNRNLKSVLASVHDAVKNGAAFSSALSEYPRIFPPVYIAMIRSGETSGALPEVLMRITEYRQRQEEVFSRFRMAIAYPALMAAVGIATIVFMLTFVMPRLVAIFTSLGQELPLPTKIVIAASAWLQNWRVWAALVLVIAAFARVAQTSAGKRAFSRLALVFPILGTLAVKIELNRFSRTLELLLKSGIPILKALDIAIPVVNNVIIREALTASHKELKQGGSFGKSLKASKVFPVFMSNLIIVGEESGKLNDALSEVAGAYEREADEAIKIMTNLLEPAMILGMGMVVGFIVIAMLLPIFEMNVIAR